MNEEYSFIENQKEVLPQSVKDFFKKQGKAQIIEFLPKVKFGELVKCCGRVNCKRLAYQVKQICYQTTGVF